MLQPGLWAIIRDDYLIYEVPRANTQETHRPKAFSWPGFLKGGGGTNYNLCCWASQEREVASWHPGSHSAAEQMARFSEDSLRSLS